MFGSSSGFKSTYWRLCLFLLLAWASLTATSKPFSASSSSAGFSRSKATDSNDLRVSKSNTSPSTSNSAVSGTKSSSSSRNEGKSLAKEREALYEAYNLLHTLAQDFHKPFDAPAVIVVGHQTSGKSALIEALMGFQFNQVGGGTKTRRPIALRMQYNPNCITPLCFLTLENGKEEQRSLADIQAYIEAENKRLERDPSRSFDPREINIRMEYRYCPNMIVIDTPGMIHPPKGRQLTPQQRALAQASREAEALVLSKIRCQDYIILCVEDTTDWKHATTRNVVMQADPQLARTVLVTTKLDTKLPQFSEADDLEDFLAAPLIRTLFSQMLGGPYFTSVPSGRVGSSRDLDTNDAFVETLRRAERSDRSYCTSKMGAMRSRGSLQNVGVSRLRAFLEARVEDCYRRNVAKIVPLLQSELRHTESKLSATEDELNSLSLERLKQTANMYREKFSKELNSVIQGTVRASPEEFGETLESEQLKGGSFLHNDQMQSDRWQETIELEVGNNHHKLFGGAQFHRAMREFTVAVRHMNAPLVTEDEIANAAGMGDTHNGVNFMRAACVIAMEKAQVSFEPMLEALRHRAAHIMKRLHPVLLHLIRQSIAQQQWGASSLDVNNRPFQEMIRRIYEKFIDQKLDECVQKCRDDLFGMTKFVTWDVEDKSGSSTLFRLLPTPKRMVEIYNFAREKKDGHQTHGAGSGGVGRMMHDDLDDELLDDTDDVFLEHDRSGAQPSNSNKKGVTGRSTAAAKSSKGVSAKILDEWNQANNIQGAKSKSSQQTKKVKVGGLSKTAASLMSTRQPNNKAAGKGGKPSVTAIASSTLVSSSARSSGLNKEQLSLAVKDEDSELHDYFKVMQLTEEMVSGSSASRTSALITSLVQFIISSWRNHFARSTAMKFNCFFLMPFMADFPDYLRTELDKVYEGGVAELFDIAETRRSLLAKRDELLAECEANSKLQRRFDQIAAQLRSSLSGADGSNNASSSGVGDMDADEDVLDQFADASFIAKASSGNDGSFYQSPSDNSSSKRASSYDTFPGEDEDSRE